MFGRLFPFGLGNEMRFWFIRTFKTRNCIKPNKDWVFTRIFNDDEMAGEDK